MKKLLIKYLPWLLTISIYGVYSYQITDKNASELNLIAGFLILAYFTFHIYNYLLGEDIYMLKYGRPLVKGRDDKLRAAITFLYVVFVLLFILY